MTKHEKLCLKMRNRNGQEKETYCQHYIKKFGGYLFHLFFGFQNLSVFIFGLVITLFAVYGTFDFDGYLLKYVPWLIAGFADFFWVYFIIQGLWFWKYSKHVFVTNEGIWIMSFSTFWWSGAPDFMGKRKFWAPSWSLYSWSELKNVSDSKKGNPKSVSKIANAFESIDDFVKRLTGLKTIYLTRWDGIECIDFLSKADAKKILEDYKEKKSRRKSKKNRENELITD